MAELPNLAGIATKDLVESIGTGRFQASYINWSRTMNLLHQHAPGWMVDYEPTDSGYDQPKCLLHRAPVGGYLMIRFRHVDGTVTPSVPQAVMDNRNNAIPYEKITARDVTDTQRRGMCMAAAMTFGLAYELWAKMPMESGYGDAAPDSAPKPGTTKTAPTTDAAGDAKGSEEGLTDEQFFRQLCKTRGLSEAATFNLEKKLKGKFKVGISTINSKTDTEIKQLEAEHGSN
jgi:hypothetical protein